MKQKPTSYDVHVLIISHGFLLKLLQPICDGEKN